MNTKTSNCINLLFLGVFILISTTIKSKSFSNQFTCKEFEHMTCSLDDSLISIKISGHWVDILYPDSFNPKGNILVLPGWNFSRQDWCQKANLCKKALTEEYCLIFPEMGKSIYASQHYPETRKDWLQYPTLTWVLDSLFPHLQENYNLLQNHQKNYILGLSTGGRGVALIALRKPELFKGAAALSGDFDQTKIPQDNLMKGFYGDYDKFPQRWEGKDNPQKLVKNFKTPIYLGHGKLDKVVPPDQTLKFYQALRQANPALKVILHLPNAAHDYAYWGSETEAILDFFDATQ